LATVLCRKQKKLGYVITVKISMALSACAVPYWRSALPELFNSARSEDKLRYCISIFNDFDLKDGGAIENAVKVQTAIS